MADFEPHSQKQQDLVYSRNDLTIAGTGTQWGKSKAGAVWMRFQIHEFTDPDSNFLLMAPTYKIMKQSMLPYFLKIMKGLGQYGKVDSEFILNDGRTVFFRTETDPDSIVGVPNVRAYWLDEAGLVSLYFHENIQARAAAKGARGLYTTSPYSRNWIYKDFIKPKQKGQLEELTFIQAASWENPFHSLYDVEKRNLMRSQMDPRRFDMVFGGNWGQQAGLVYDCFDEDANIAPADLRLPNGTMFYAGVDWGHTEPFVIVVRAVTPDGMHYQVSEFYKTGMTVPKQVEIALQKMQIFNIRTFFCGHERPENILLFNQNGLPAVPVAEKDIQVGTDLHYELIKTRKYKILEGTSPYTIDEMETYHYPEPEDLGPDEDSEDQKPVGQNDHAMSANRFVTLKTYRGTGTKFKPHSPEEEQRERHESQAQRIKRLTRPTTRTRVVG